VVAQRAGPSTGLPTRTEQSDLNFVIHASHGEFPRAVFAPGHAEQAFYCMGKAFNLAERYQTPVIVLGDQHLNDSYFTLDHLDLNQIKIDHGKIVSESDMFFAEDYRRYSLDESGISSRILPGKTGAVLYADSDEHTEAGHITENAEVRKKMMLKRMKKLEGLSLEMDPPEIYPSGESDILLVGWGSTYGALREATDLLNHEGVRSRMVHFSDIFPFPKKDHLSNVRKTTRIFVAENNYTAQFSKLFESNTGIAVSHRILKYDGRPFSPEEIVNHVKKHV
jgi:2-oxoglutarate ferredoxin oxidoreductase subunit alpha